jgi:hypothetical protein
MIESPVLQQLKAEWTREAKRRAILDVLVARFGAAAEELGAQLETINDEGRLKELVRFSALCPDLEAFQRRLSLAGG